MRLCHFSERGLVRLGKNMLGGVMVQKLEFYEPYVFGKACKVNFNKGKKRTHGFMITHESCEYSFKNYG